MRLNQDLIQRMFDGRGGVAGGGSSLDPGLINGLATEMWTEENYVSKTFFNELFVVHKKTTTTVYDGDTVVSTTTDTSGTFAPNEIPSQEESTDSETGYRTVVVTEVDNIEAKKGLWTDFFLSALGLNGSGGGGGIGDVTWQALGDNTDTRQIASSHLTTALGSALAGYATQSWVTSQNYVTSSAISDMATKTWVNNQSFVNWTALGDTTTTQQIALSHLTTALSGYATQTWVTNNFSTPSSVATQLQTYAKIQNGTITIGDNSLTPITSVTGTFWGKSFTNGGTVNGTIKAGSNGGAIEQFHSVEMNSAGTLAGYGGFIDFHYYATGSTFDSTLDYTSRIIESEVGVISILAKNNNATNANKLAGLLVGDGYDGSYVQIGNIRIVYDSTNNALKVVKLVSGTEVAANFYATGSVSALGYGAGGGGGTGDVTWTNLADNTDTRPIALSHLTGALSGYATTSQLAGYLPLRGGTLTNTVRNLFALNQTGTSTDGAFMYFEQNGLIDFAFGYHNNVGAFIDVYNNGSYTGSASLYISLTDIKYKNNVIWHAGNDGAGSGLDADLLDGLNSTYFLRDPWSVSGGLYDAGMTYRVFNTATEVGLGLRKKDTSYMTYLGLKDAYGYIAITNDVGSARYFQFYYNGSFSADGTITGGAIKTHNGTSSQFLKADGSVDSNTYATTTSLGNYLPLTAGISYPLTGQLYIAESNGDSLQLISSGSRACIVYGAATGVKWSVGVDEATESFYFFSWNRSTSAIYITKTGQLVSTIATGTAPFAVTSSTLVSNLNADTVDGFNAEKLLRDPWDASNGIYDNNYTFRVYNTSTEVGLGFRKKDNGKMLYIGRYDEYTYFVSGTGAARVRLYDNGELSVPNNANASGFVKNSSSDSYVLTGGGGHALISSLSVSYAASAGTATDSTKLPLAGGTLSNTNRDLLKLQQTGTGAIGPYIICKIDSKNKCSFGYDSSKGFFIDIYKSDQTLDKSFVVGSTGLTFDGKKVWYEDNDGAGSGLDADLLDGQHGSYYATASSVTTLQGYFTNGSAKTAIKLATAVNLWGRSFDGSSDISGALTATGITCDYIYKGTDFYVGDYSHAYGGSTKGLVFYVYNGDLLISNPAHVGIGTRTPSYYLHVNGTFCATNTAIFENSIATGTSGGAIEGFQSWELNTHNTAGTNIGGFLDFHYNGTGQDYSVRLIEKDYSGVLQILAKDTGTGNAQRAGLIVGAGTYTSFIQIGNGRIVWNDSDHALRIVDKDGNACNLYATGGISALGYQSGGGGGGSTGVFSTSITPDTTGTYDLGTSTYKWRNLYLAGANGGNGFSIMTSYTGYVYMGAASSKIRIGATLDVLERISICAEANQGSAYDLYVSGDNEGDAYFGGNVSVYSLTQRSDVRYKDIIGDVTLTIQQIASAPVFQFMFKEQRKNKRMSVGTSAQYWDAVMPEVVTRDADGMLGLDYGVTALVSTIILAKGMTEHERRITKLEMENAELRARIKDLEEN